MYFTELKRLFHGSFKMQGTSCPQRAQQISVHAESSLTSHIQIKLQWRYSLLMPSCAKINHGNCSIVIHPNLKCRNYDASTCYKKKMVPEKLWPALAGSNVRRPCQPMFPTSNHLSYIGGLLKPQEKAETCFWWVFPLQLFSIPPETPPHIDIWLLSFT